MKKVISVFSLVFAVFQSHASNWEKASGKPGQKCISSYTLNMKPVETMDLTHIRVSQKSIGFSDKGVVALKKENPDMFGEGFLDIGVEKIGSKGGVDRWKECTLK